MRGLLFAPALLCALLCAGCPQPKEGSATKDPDPGKFSPSAVIPADNPLIAYDKLKLGMSSLDVSQAYNAPEGKGKGFTRVIQDFGAASNQIIEFDATRDAPRRRIVLRIYRDQLCKLVDRRDGLSAKQTDDWFAALKKQYGDSFHMTVPGAQWSWGDKQSVLLTFTRDNASGTDESANLILVHGPSYDASLDYLEAWEKVHPAPREERPVQSTSGPGPDTSGT